MFAVRANMEEGTGTERDSRIPLSAVTVQCPAAAWVSLFFVFVCCCRFFVCLGFFLVFVLALGFVVLFWGFLNYFSITSYNFYIKVI